MGTQFTHSTLLETITRRQAVLLALEDGPVSKRTLDERLDCSRSTVDRSIRELESQGLAVREQGDVRLTAAGTLVFEEYSQHLEIVESIDSASHLLQYIPADAPLSAALLDGATIHEPEPYAPNEPLETIALLLDDAEHFRGFAATERIPQFRQTLTERALAGKLDGEAVFTDELVTFLLETHPESVQELCVDGTFEVYTRSSIPYCLVLIDTPTQSHAFVIVAENERIRGVIENTSPAATTWAAGLYRRYRASAMSLRPSN